MIHVLIIAVIDGVPRPGPIHELELHEAHVPRANITVK